MKKMIFFILFSLGLAYGASAQRGGFSHGYAGGGFHGGYHSYYSPRVYYAPGYYGGWGLGFGLGFGWGIPGWYGPWVRGCLLMAILLTIMAVGRCRRLCRIRSMVSRATIRLRSRMCDTIRPFRTATNRQRSMTWRNNGMLRSRRPGMISSIRRCEIITDSSNGIMGSHSTIASHKITMRSQRRAMATMVIRQTTRTILSIRTRMLPTPVNNNLGLVA